MVASEHPSPFFALVLSLETEDSAEDAVQKLARAKISTEDVLRALVRWKSVDKAAAFFGAWADSDPLFGCDAEESGGSPITARMVSLQSSSSGALSSLEAAPLSSSQAVMYR